MMKKVISTINQLVGGIYSGSIEEPDSAFSAALYDIGGLNAEDIEVNQRKEYDSVESLYEDNKDCFTTLFSDYSKEFKYRWKNLEKLLNGIKTYSNAYDPQLHQISLQRKDALLAMLTKMINKEQITKTHYRVFDQERSSVKAQERQIVIHSYYMEGPYIKSRSIEKVKENAVIYLITFTEMFESNKQKIKDTFQLLLKTQSDKSDKAVKLIDDISKDLTAILKSKPEAFSSTMNEKLSTYFAEIQYMESLKDKEENFRIIQAFNDVPQSGKNKVSNLLTHVSKLHNLLFKDLKIETEDHQGDADAKAPQEPSSTTAQHPQTPQTPQTPHTPHTVPHSVTIDMNAFVPIAAGSTAPSVPPVRNNTPEQPDQLPEAVSPPTVEVPIDTPADTNRLPDTPINASELSDRVSPADHTKNQIDALVKEWDNISEHDRNGRISLLFQDDDTLKAASTAYTGADKKQIEELQKIVHERSLRINQENNYAQELRAAYGKDQPNYDENLNNYLYYRNETHTHMEDSTKSYLQFKSAENKYDQDPTAENYEKMADAHRNYMEDKQQFEQAHAEEVTYFNKFRAGDEYAEHERSYTPDIWESSPQGVSFPDIELDPNPFAAPVIDELKQDGAGAPDAKHNVETTNDTAVQKETEVEDPLAEIDLSGIADTTATFGDTIGNSMLYAAIFTVGTYTANLVRRGLAWCYPEVGASLIKNPVIINVLNGVGKAGEVLSMPGEKIASCLKDGSLTKSTVKRAVNAVIYATTIAVVSTAIASDEDGSEDTDYIAKATAAAAAALTSMGINATLEYIEKIVKRCFAEE